MVYGEVRNHGIIVLPTEPSRFSMRSRLRSAVKMSRPVRLGRSDNPLLWESVKHDPHDSAPWLILADSLDESGKPHTANFFRNIGTVGSPQGGTRPDPVPHMTYEEEATKGVDGNGRDESRSAFDVTGHVAGVPLQIRNHKGWSVVYFHPHNMYSHPHREAFWCPGTAWVTHETADKLISEMEETSPARWHGRAEPEQFARESAPLKPNGCTCQFPDKVIKNGSGHGKDGYGKMCPHHRSWLEENIFGRPKRKKVKNSRADELDPMEQEAFHRAIEHNPHDAAPRLIYADWLEEHGLPAHAHVIRDGAGSPCHEFTRLDPAHPSRIPMFGYGGQRGPVGGPLMGNSLASRAEWGTARAYFASPTNPGNLFQIGTWEAPYHDDSALATYKAFLSEMASDLYDHRRQDEFHAQRQADREASDRLNQEWGEQQKMSRRQPVRNAREHVPGILQAAESNPGDPGPLHMLADCLDAMGKPEHAAFMRKVASSPPNMFPAFGNPNDPKAYHSLHSYDRITVSPHRELAAFTMRNPDRFIVTPRFLGGVMLHGSGANGLLGWEIAPHEHNPGDSQRAQIERLANEGAIHVRFGDRQSGEPATVIENWQEGSQKMSMRGRLRQAVRMNEPAFRRSMMANHDDDAPKLIYADWLDERGRPDEAAAVRHLAQHRGSLPDGLDPEQFYNLLHSAGAHGWRTRSEWEPLMTEHALVAPHMFRPADAPIDDVLDVRRRLIGHLRAVGDPRAELVDADTKRRLAIVEQGGNWVFHHDGTRRLIGDIRQDTGDGPNPSRHSFNPLSGINMNIYAKAARGPHARKPAMTLGASWLATNGPILPEQISEGRQHGWGGGEFPQEFQSPMLVSKAHDFAERLPAHVGDPILSQLERHFPHMRPKSESFSMKARLRQAIRMSREPVKMGVPYPENYRLGNRPGLAHVGYDQLDQWLGKRSERRLGSNKRIVRDADGDIHTILHNTPVVTAHADGTYTLRSGGYRTETTRKTINTFSPARLSFAQRGGTDWFFDGARVDHTGTPLHLLLPSESRGLMEEANRESRYAPLHSQKPAAAHLQLYLDRHRDVPGPEHAMMMDHVLSNPHDDSPWLIYADWLDEHGHGGKAASIRRHFMAPRQFSMKSRFRQAVKMAMPRFDAPGAGHDPELHRAILARPDVRKFGINASILAGMHPSSVQELADHLGIRKASGPAESAYSPSAAPPPAQREPSEPPFAIPVAKFAPDGSTYGVKPPIRLPWERKQQAIGYDPATAPRPMPVHPGSLPKALPLADRLALPVARTAPPPMPHERIGPPQPMMGELVSSTPSRPLPPPLPSERVGPQQPRMGRLVSYSPSKRLSMRSKFRQAVKMSVMSDHDMFLRGISMDPKDHASPLIYSDWLEEHGKPTHAKIIRTHIAQSPDWSFHHLQPAKEHPFAHEFYDDTGRGDLFRHLILHPGQTHAHSYEGPSFGSLTVTTSIPPPRTKVGSVKKQGWLPRLAGWTAKYDSIDELMADHAALVSEGEIGTSSAHYLPPWEVENWPARGVGERRRRLMRDRLKSAIRLQREPLRFAAVRDRGIDINGAAARIQSSNHGELLNVLRNTLTRSGLVPHKVSPAIHDFAGSARAAAIAEVFGERMAGNADYGAAWQGLIAKQPALVVFRSHPQGADSVYKVAFKGPQKAFSQLLDQIGVSNRVYVPHQDGTHAYLYDPQRKLRDTIGGFVSQMGLQAVEHVGNGEPVGGGDDMGRAQYRDEIRQAEGGQQAQQMSRGGKPVRFSREAVIGSLMQYRRDPHDDAPPLIMADALDDLGKPAHAAHIRSMIRNPSVPRTNYQSGLTEQYGENDDWFGHDEHIGPLERHAIENPGTWVASGPSSYGQHQDHITLWASVPDESPLLTKKGSVRKSWKAPGRQLIGFPHKYASPEEAMNAYSEMLQEGAFGMDEEGRPTHVSGHLPWHGPVPTEHTPRPSIDDADDRFRQSRSGRPVRMMSRDDSLAHVRHMIANPHDAAPPLIYADHLDESGNPLGELVRSAMSHGKFDKETAVWGQPTWTMRNHHEIAHHDDLGFDRYGKVRYTDIGQLSARDHLNDPSRVHLEWTPHFDEVDGAKTYEYPSFAAEMHRDDANRILSYMDERHPDTTADDNDAKGWALMSRQGGPVRFAADDIRQAVASGNRPELAQALHMHGLPALAQAVTVGEYHPGGVNPRRSYAARGPASLPLEVGVHKHGPTDWQLTMHWHDQEQRRPIGSFAVEPHLAMQAWNDWAPHAQTFPNWRENLPAQEPIPERETVDQDARMTNVERVGHPLHEEANLGATRAAVPFSRLDPAVYDPWIKSTARKAITANGLNPDAMPGFKDFESQPIAQTVAQRAGGDHDKATDLLHTLGDPDHALYANVKPTDDFNRKFWSHVKWGLKKQEPAPSTAINDQMTVRPTSAMRTPNAPEAKVSDHILGNPGIARADLMRMNITDAAGLDSQIARMVQEGRIKEFRQYNGPKTRYTTRYYPADHPTPDAPQSRMDEVAGLLKTGLSRAEIAKKLGVSFMSVQSAVNSAASKGLVEAPKRTSYAPQIVELAGQGLKNNEIAKKLGVGSSTVTNALKRALQKAATLSREGRPVNFGRSDNPLIWEQVKADPHDSAPWLILADSLDESGKPNAAAHMRMVGSKGQPTHDYLTRPASGGQAEYLHMWLNSFAHSGEPMPHLWANEYVGNSHVGTIGGVPFKIHKGTVHATVGHSNTRIRSAQTSEMHPAYAYVSNEHADALIAEMDPAERPRTSWSRDDQPVKLSREGVEAVYGEITKDALNPDLWHMLADQLHGAGKPWLAEAARTMAGGKQGDYGVGGQPGDPKEYLEAVHPELPKRPYDTRESPTMESAGIRFWIAPSGHSTFRGSVPVEPPWEIMFSRDTPGRHIAGVAAVPHRIGVGALHEADREIIEDPMQAMHNPPRSYAEPLKQAYPLPAEPERMSRADAQALADALEPFEADVTGERPIQLAGVGEPIRFAKLPTPTWKMSPEEIEQARVDYNNPHLGKGEEYFGNVPREDPYWLRRADRGQDVPPGGRDDTSSNWIPLVSSWLAGARRLKGSNAIDIMVKKSGKVYRYDRAPRGLFPRFLAAHSKGKAWHAMFKGLLSPATKLSMKSRMKQAVKMQMKQ